MTPTMIGIVGILILIAVLFFLGIPVGFAMAIVGFVGFWYVVSFNAAINMVGGRYLEYLLQVRSDGDPAIHFSGIPGL